MEKYAFTDKFIDKEKILVLSIAVLQGMKQPRCLGVIVLHYLQNYYITTPAESHERSSASGNS